MATSNDSQPGGDLLSVSRAWVYRRDVETQRWLDTGGISRIYLRRIAFVYQMDGQLESTGQITIKATLGQNSKYSIMDGDPHCYMLTISPHEVYAFRTVADDEESKQFVYVLQNVLRILGETKTRPEESPSSPREAWPNVQAAPSSPQHLKEQVLNTSSNLGNRNPTLAHSSSRHLANPLITNRELSSSTPNLSDKRTAQKQQRIDTVNTSALDQRLTSIPAVRRSDFEVQVESLCDELAHVIGVGDVETAVEIVRSMAQEQIPLSIKMKNPKIVAVEQAKETIDLKVVVEDREASGGVFVMKVLPSTKVQQLQEEVAERYGFPPKVQKWIIGKMMARPPQTLADCHVKKTGHTAFLYLISSKSAGLTRGEFEKYVQRDELGNISAVGQQMSYVARTDLVSPIPGTTHLSRATSMPALNATTAPTAPGTEVYPSRIQTRPINQDQGLDRRDQRILGAGNIADIEQELQREAAMMPVLEGDVLNEGHSIPVEDTEEVPLGWKCSACTYVNTPTRPGCEMCGGDRPEDYVVPENTMIREQERIRIAEERRQQELFEQALQKQEQEQAIARQRNFQQLVQTAQQSLIQNIEEFDCAICFTSVLPREGVVLRECLHSFCRDCLREHIRNCTDPEVQCPFQDDEFACHSLITAQEVKSLLSPEDFNKYLNRSLATAESQAANSFHCKTPNCPGWCIYEDNSNIFHCPVCDKQNCLTCKAQHFPDMDCKEYQDDLKRRAINDKAAQQTQTFLETMIAKGEAMKCPQCEIILLKKDGCDWMRCSMCRLEICWATRGPRWGPQGVGDISGGCKCRVEGKKCHPKCHNCH